ncbi:hypothetical protein FGE12_14225 [Aggregicoccus sp. 17bor-14]|uniref:hypothetical protein n=1 Tax=Myxococcaceae TaxID=31 RepID=UPI00129C4EE1|nr:MULTISPECIES: hypothetical protein [Myxococcaceae]MBF5043550.1 hypothetical protein [Simulacricoccus sp. 17bor-14]MRI89309.1 hypothetical protein [Aggregicoccus sp. 17bor-14]
MAGRWSWAVGVAVACAAWACGGNGERNAPVAPPPVEAPTPGPQDAAPDAGTQAEPDAGTVVQETPDAGNPGPWPTDGLKDYTRAYALGANVQSVGVDEAYNVWLLRGDEIGVLRPGDTRPTWTRGVGQASRGFSVDALAVGSTVICGGGAGKAYVGYRAAGINGVCGHPHAWMPSPGEECFSEARWAEYQKGDLDAVQVGEDGRVSLEEHLFRSVGTSGGKTPLGIHNTNDYHFDEDRTILSCARVMRGPLKGDLYIGSNHGVTRIQGLVYNSHRHPGWYYWPPGVPHDQWSGSLITDGDYAVGIGQQGDVLIANPWMVGAIRPSAPLKDWDRETGYEGASPWLFRGYNPKLNGLNLDSPDDWRAITQTTDGNYWVGSRRYGLWRLERPVRSGGVYTQVTALPTSNVSALAGTDDGALYVGTDGAGLWRLEAGSLTPQKVDGVAGGKVLQLVYDPTLTPSMLYVLTDAGLTVLRGP